MSQTRDVPGAERGAAAAGSRVVEAGAAEDLPADLVAFCQMGTSIVLAAVAEGRPVVGRGTACRIAGRTVRIVLRERPNARVLRALAAGSAIAATFTLPTTHGSIQLKGDGAQRCPVGPADGPAALAQSTAFAADLLACGYAEAFVAAYCAYEPHELVAIEFAATAAYTQTPGPSAGSALP